ncbi:hypothetical protein ABT329_42625, partial [Streptomyces minutiscleroticus]
HRWPRPSEIGGEDGYQDFAGRIPLLATSLRLLAAKGPYGPVWWRYGHSEYETLAVALADLDGLTAYRERDQADRRRAEEIREQRAAEAQAEAEAARRRREARAWPCPGCGRPLHPHPDFQMGDHCAACAREVAEARAGQEEAEAAARPRRLFGRRT